MPKPRIRVLIIGAGVAGREAVAEMRSHPEYGYEPLGFVDDDPAKRGREMAGLRVLGARGDIPELVREHAVDEILIAMPSESGAVIRQLVLACAQAKVAFKIVPGIREIILGDVRIEQIRHVEPEDLLGRESVDLSGPGTPGGAAGEFLRGRTVLVTGAGGSIGSELCRQALAAGAQKLLLLGRGENSIFEIESELQPDAAGRAELRPLIADVRDERVIRELFARARPAIVFHAAAHKHVPYMEHFPGEALLRNVVGTRNVIRAARAAGSERLVVISTDKAAGAQSVMGATKRLAEELVRGSATPDGLVVTAVRFGNVLGSRGSVVPLFKRQIARGGPVTVSDPEATRYFMTVREAAALVIQAASLGRGAEVFVLDMGQPIRILELAKDLIIFSGYRPDVDIPIQVTGLRPGERRHEILQAADETLARTSHPKIQVVHTARPIRPDLDSLIDRLAAAAESCDQAEVMALLAEAVPEFGQRDLNRAERGSA
jgi:FlaA1/EpsC-like NDP-sugar epimerase